MLLLGNQVNSRAGAKWNFAANGIYLNTGGADVLGFRLSGSLAIIEHTATTGDLYIRSFVAGDSSGNLILNDLGGSTVVGGTAALGPTTLYGATPADTFENQLAVAVTGTSTAINTGAAITMYGYGASGQRGFANIRAFREDAVSGNYGAYLSFGTRANGSSTIDARMRISSTGLVAINLNAALAPVGRFEVHGTSDLAADGRSAQLGLYDTAVMAANNGATLVLGGRYFSGVTPISYAAIRGQKENATDANTSGYLSFFTRTNGQALTTERMRITSAGLLCLGNTSGTARLNIVAAGSGEVINMVGTGATGDTSIGFLSFYDSNGTTRRGFIGDASSADDDIYLRAETGILRLGDSTGSSAVVISGGNLGINATVPGQRLVVGGNVHVTGTYGWTSGTIGNKILLYDNLYGIGIEASTLTNWAGTQFRWRVGGTDVASGTERMLLTGTALTVAGRVGATGFEAKTLTHAANATLNAADCYGAIHYVTAAATLTLPAVATGMSLTVATIGNIAVSVKPNAADRLFLDGLQLDDADKATNKSTRGDIITLTYYSAIGWYASSNSWTDTGA